jgi:hypothetical protein
MGRDHADLLDQFASELAATYRGETYRVRDNGAVYRLRRTHLRMRPLDEIWTFGTPNNSTGYMHIGSEVVHRIVATAFHGEQPSDKHIVDHIDTNRKTTELKICVGLRDSTTFCSTLSLADASKSPMALSKPSLKTLVLSIRME